MKTKEFTFDSEQEYNTALDVLTAMRAENPVPKIKPCNTVAIFENEAAEFQRRVAEKGLAPELTYEGEISDEQFVNA